MFVQEIAFLDCPFDDVARRLEAAPAEVLGPVPDPEDTGEVRRKVGPEGWPATLARTVVVRVGPVRRRDAELLVALTWEPDRSGALLPSLEADLQIAPYGTSETILTLRGRYEPPAGALGRRVDGLVLHRLAEATVRAFLGDVRDRLDPAVRRPLDAQGR